MGPTKAGYPSGVCLSRSTRVLIRPSPHNMHQSAADFQGKRSTGLVEPRERLALCFVIAILASYACTCKAPGNLPEASGSTGRDTYNGPGSLYLNYSC